MVLIAGYYYIDKFKVLQRRQVHVRFNYVKRIKQNVLWHFIKLRILNIYQQHNKK